MDLQDILKSYLKHIKHVWQKNVSNHQSEFVFNPSLQWALLKSGVWGSNRVDF